MHAFGPGTSVWLCGVEIPHDHGLVGHSDADVGLHALTDALLGTIGDGDIGEHFPPSDPQWKGASSDRFLADAVRRVRERGGRIVNLDVTLVCERPKIAPHRDAMRARVAEIAGIDAGRVGVKATTSERLGFTGRGEGIAAFAIATVALPPRSDERRLRRAGRRGRRAARRLPRTRPEARDGRILHRRADRRDPDRGRPARRTSSSAASSPIRTRRRREMLGVPARLIERHGAVSEEVARAMAEGALAHSRADIAVAVTGVAGPGGGTAAKPVGLVHLAAPARGRRRCTARSASATSAAATIRCAVGRGVGQALLSAPRPSAQAWSTVLGPARSRFGRALP